MWLLSMCAVKLFMKNHSHSIRESVGSLCRDGAGAQYTQYLNKSCIIRVSCLVLEISEFRCCKAIMEEGEKADSHGEWNPGHLWLEPPVLYH